MQSAKSIALNTTPALSVVNSENSIPQDGNDKKYLVDLLMEKHKEHAAPFYNSFHEGFAGLFDEMGSSENPYVIMRQFVALTQLFVNPTVQEAAKKIGFCEPQDVVKMFDRMIHLFCYLDESNDELFTYIGPLEWNPKAIVKAANEMNIDISKVMQEKPAKA